MAKTYETGHAKNVENFYKLDDRITSFGNRYAPSDSRLQQLNIDNIKQSATNALAQLAAANPPYLQAIGRREAAFTNLASTASRALKIAEILHLDVATIRALKELVRKLYGRRAVPKKITQPNHNANTETTEQEHRYISVSQLSFDQRIEHFSQFIEILKAETTYQPVETDLSVNGLIERLDEMRASNKAVTPTIITLTKARNTRNAILYPPVTGLVDVALDIKKYIRAAFGDKSPEYLSIKGLQFRKN
ncbi:MAG: hypothetical protein LBD91_02120 [Prevotellaceae bacterium]|jgi:hypothetical protein|nr:hypothetical protein [Prevotellaceae bacterium]